MSMQKLGKGLAERGVPLPHDIFGEDGKLLLRQGHVITDQKLLDTLLKRGLYVDTAAAAAKVQEDLLGGHKYDPFWLWDEIIGKLGHLLRQYDDEDDIPSHFVFLSRLVQMLNVRSKDAALAAMILLTDQSRYSLVHCLHAALLCDMVATRLEWSEERRRSLVCAAMTMNISMVDSQQRLAEQAEPLTPDQRLDIKTHPKSSADILNRVGVEDSIWLQAVHDHHETPLGNGYPTGIKEIGEEATLLRTADVFSAKISPRQNRKQMSGAQAARVLFTDPGMTTANPFIAVLIKEVGIYPPGSFVRLATGETGIVYKRSGNAHTPVVLSLTNSRGTPEARPIRRDTSREEFKIMSIVPRENIMIRINPVSIWGSPV
jgi:HD-GYP domain-containing protein (c-di-GMP phosphodiesterase class II)